MPDTSFSPLTARDGTNLVVMDWPLQKAPVRGVVLIVHGLGEHAWRYDALAQELNSWGFAVRAYDQFGHSMGGLVAARFVSLGMRKLDGLVLSSPALDPGLDPLQRLLLAVLPRLLPNLRVGNGLKPEFISHDAQVVAQYKADPLVHDRISARLAKFIADGGPATIACAPSWALPTLLLYAGADKLADPAGSRAFASAAPPTVLTSRCFDALYHELFNEAEPGRRQVLAQLKSWLDARF